VEVFHTSIGAIHTLFAIVAMISGGLVVLNTKGNLAHKKLGYIYVISMIAMNVTALFTQTLFVFGPFHFLAVFSLATIFFGMAWPLFSRRNSGWLYWHFQAMSWSYIGLWAAFISEIAVRLPFIDFGWMFGLAVGISTIFVCALGGYFVVKYKKRLTAIANK
jgi:uncharacterized membrane protein